MYITFDEYIQLYDPIEERAFNSFAFDACRVMDIYTTGIDGVKKLKTAFPTDEDDAQAVKHCVAKVINLLHQIQEAERAFAVARGYRITEQGVMGKVISSMTVGSESVSYSTNIAESTSIDAAVADKKNRDVLIARTIKESLSGICDANGVNLLYMGVYPLPA